MENHFEQFNEVFGNAEFNVRRAFPDEVDRGSKYDIELPFSHLKYERILDLNTSSTAPTRETLYNGGIVQVVILTKRRCYSCTKGRL
jgi:hypothetical protein